MVVSGPQVRSAKCMSLFAGGVIMAALGERVSGRRCVDVRTCVAHAQCVPRVVDARKTTHNGSDRESSVLPLFTALLVAVGMLLLVHCYCLPTLCTFFSPNFSLNASCVRAVIGQCEPDVRMVEH